MIVIARLAGGRAAESWRRRGGFASLRAAGARVRPARCGVSNDEWEYSTEGDLDPDLTEEAGYAHWEPTRRRLWTPTVLRIGTAVVLALLLGGVLLAVVR